MAGPFSRMKYKHLLSGVPELLQLIISRSGRQTWNTELICLFAVALQETEQWRKQNTDYT
jgi:hypothetical protein